MISNGKRSLLAVMTGALMVSSAGLPAYAATSQVTDVLGDTKAKALMSVERDDRSADLNGASGKYYYDVAVVDSSVGSAQAINAAIAQYRDQFFSEDSYKPESFGGADTVISYARLRDLYLDERYLSINMVHYHTSSRMATDAYGYCGYTFDLATGMETGLTQILGISEDTIREMIWSRLQECKTNPDIVVPESREAFLSNGAWMQYHFSIREDGRIYLMYDKNQVAPGAAGSVEIYLTDLPAAGEAHYLKQGEEEEIGAVKYFLTDEQIQQIKDALGGVRGDDYTQRIGWPYYWDGNGLWMTPVEFYDNATSDLVSACDYSTRTGDMKGIYVTGW